MYETDSEALFMAELKAEFLEKCQHDLVSMQDHLQTGQMHELAKLAHDIKGTAGLFGFPEATECARALQLSAQAGDQPQCTVLLAQLRGLIPDAPLS